MWVLECSGGAGCEATLVIVESAALLAFAATAAEAFEVVGSLVVLQSRRKLESERPKLTEARDLPAAAASCNVVLNCCSTTLQ